MSQPLSDPPKMLVYTREQRRQDKIDRLLELLLRTMEYRKLVQSNVFFPTVPDSIISPLLQLLQQNEHKLVTALWDEGEIEKLTALTKML